MRHGFHRKTARDTKDEASLRTYRAISPAGLAALWVASIGVLVVSSVWLGPYALPLLPLMGIPLGRYYRGRRVQRRMDSN